MAEFSSEDEYVAAIIRLFAGANLPESVLSEFALRLESLEKIRLEEEEPPPGNPEKYINRHFRWIIADDDLKAIEAFCAALIAAAPVHFFMGEHGPTAGAATGVLVAGAKLFGQAAKKGAHVSAAQLRVLLILKYNRPKGLTIDELLDIMRRTPPVEQAEVEKALAELEKLPLHDGTVRGFVAQDGTGRWHAAGV